MLLPALFVFSALVKIMGWLWEFNPPDTPKCKACHELLA
jgi:hypothetical protein